MPLATLTDFTYSGGISTAPARQALLQACSNALVAAGCTDVDTYVIDGSNDARVVSVPHSLRALRFSDSGVVPVT